MTTGGGSRRLETVEGEGIRVAGRADFDPQYDPTAPIECEVCGSPMEYRAGCKIVCRNCGYERDCSDP